MFQSWVTRQVRKSGGHPVTKKRRRRIALSLELCEDRLPPGQILSFLNDPFTDVLGPAPLEQPGPSLGEDTLATPGYVRSLGGKVPTAASTADCRVVTTAAAVTAVIHQHLPPRPTAGAQPLVAFEHSWTDDLLESAFVTQQAPVLGALNALPATQSAEHSFAEYAREQPRGPHVPNVLPGREPGTTPGRVRGPNGMQSIQVNVDADGNNIVGDAANEPSLAVDPTDPRRIVIGWRQFDTVTSSFRQAGWGYSHDAGRSWTFPGVIEPGVFRSDPVLDVDAEGNFYYNSLTTNPYTTQVFKSTNGGVSWDSGTFAYGGDKQWMVIDRTDGPGRGNIYETWNRQYTPYGGDFTRSTNGGASFTQPTNLPGSPYWGTLAVGPQSELYISGRTQAGFRALRSTNAYDPEATPTFAVTPVNLGGAAVFSGPPNPDGLLGQAWIATDHSSGPSRGNVYFLSPVDPPGPDPLDVMIARSTDGGATFSPPVRVNDGPAAAGSWQWMAAMSVAPNGRIDVVWVDTRGSLQPNLGQLYYANSFDGGATWSRNMAVSPVFDSHVGWPQQNKIGDYYQTISDDKGVNVAYAATFNNEQDVYFLRINALPRAVPLPLVPWTP